MKDLKDISPSCILQKPNFKDQIEWKQFWLIFILFATLYQNISNFNPNLTSCSLKFSKIHFYIKIKLTLNLLRGIQLDGKQDKIGNIFILERVRKGIFVGYPKD